MLCLFRNFKYVHLAFYANLCSFFLIHYYVLFYISSANYQDINSYLLFIVLHLIKYEISGCPIQKFLQGERQLHNSKQLDEKIPIRSSPFFSLLFLNSMTILFLDILLHQNLKLTKSIIFNIFVEMTQSRLEVFKHKQ